MYVNILLQDYAESFCLDQDTPEHVDFHEKFIQYLILKNMKHIHISPCGEKLLLSGLSGTTFPAWGADQPHAGCT